MSNKKLKEAMMMLSMASVISGNKYSDLEDRLTIENEKLESELKRRSDKKIENNIKKGLKLFLINGKGVWALNQKNAKRKANRLK